MTANRDKAREVAAEALLSEEAETREHLAREAIAMDEGCPEAHVALATLEDPAKARPHFEKAVEIAEARLPQGALQSYRGQLWEVEGAESYFAARDALSRCLSMLGDEKGCIESLEDMLALGGEDRLNWSHALLGYYLNDGSDEKALRLLENYPCDCAQHYYTEALLSYRRFGPADERSTHHLLEALEQYPQVPAYLLGLRTLPLTPPYGLWTSDEESQAAAYAVAQGYSWHSTPGALQWLRSVGGELLEDEGPGQAHLFCWREPAGESPALASYKAALEALLDSYATELGLDTEQHAVWQGFTYFTVSGEAWDVAEMAVMLLEDNVSDFHVHVDSEVGLEVFDSMGVEEVSVQSSVPPNCGGPGTESG